MWNCVLIVFGVFWRQFPQPMFVSGDLHEGEGEPAHDPKADHKEVVLHPHWGVWPCLNHPPPSLALFQPSWYVTTGGFGSVQSSLVLLEPPWHVTAEEPGIASCNIYHYITSEGSGLALTITNLTSWPLPTFLNLVSPNCILKTPAHHLTTNDGKNICMIVKNQYYYYRREILLAWIYFLLNMVVICSLYCSTMFPMYLVLK